MPKWLESVSVRVSEVRRGAVLRRPPIGLVCWSVLDTLLAKHISHLPTLGSTISDLLLYKV